MLKVIPAALVLAVLSLGATTQPATKPATITLDQLLAKLPANLNPKQGETPRQADERKNWLLKESKGKVFRLQFEVDRVAEGDQKGQSILSGSEKRLVRIASASYSTETNREKIYPSDIVTVEGTLRDIDFLFDVRGSWVTTSFIDCKIMNIKLQPK